MVNMKANILFAKGLWKSVNGIRSSLRMEMKSVAWEHFVIEGKKEILANYSSLVPLRNNVSILQILARRRIGCFCQSLGQVVRNVLENRQHFVASALSNGYSSSFWFAGCFHIIIVFVLFSTMTLFFTSCRSINIEVNEAITIWKCLVLQLGNNVYRVG